jgi:hypothetical protein
MPASTPASGAARAIRHRGGGPDGDRFDLSFDHPRRSAWWGGVDSNHRPTDYESADGAVRTCDNAAIWALTCGYGSRCIALLRARSRALTGWTRDGDETLACARVLECP